MKKIITSIIALVAIIGLQSFVFPTTTTETFEVKNSKVVWKGYKVTGSHEGTLALQSGNLSFDGEKLKGGSFVINMASLTCTDISEDGKKKALEEHLKSDDFFGVANHPTAVMKITKVKSKGKNSYQIKADLTIKGITKSIKFKASVYGKKATANLKIDRTDFGVKYASGSFFDGLKDKVIYDEFDLLIDLEF